MGLAVTRAQAITNLNLGLLTPPESRSDNWHNNTPVRIFDFHQTDRTSQCDWHDELDALDQA